MNEDEAIRFINSLVKNLQVLCHGSVEFKQKVEVIGHLYLNVDSDTKFDYVVNEKVCRNEESSTTFVSNSFHAGPKKTVAERKKELEEELAKLQKEQTKSQQTFLSEHKKNTSHQNMRRKYPYPAGAAGQFSFSRQSQVRRDSYPYTSPQKETDAHSVPKIPRLSFEDMSTYDINDLSSSISLSQQHSTPGDRITDDTVYMPSTSFLTSSSTSIPEASSSSQADKKSDIHISLPSIKQEKISQIDADFENNCAFERDKLATDQQTHSGNQIFGSPSILSPGEMNLLTSPHNFSVNSNNQTNFNIRSNMDQSSRHSSNSPGALSLGSPRASTFVGSPPSMSQGSSSAHQKRQYICDCGKAFITPHGFSGHKKKHSGIYRFYCSVCNKGCSNKHQLEGHMNKHCNIKPFKCDHCERSFGFQSALKRHLLLVHKQNTHS